MLSLRFKEDQIIWLALIGSLLIHSLIFIFSGLTFIQHAQYSVQPSAQMVEVSISVIARSASQRREATQQSFNSKEISASPLAPPKDIKLKQAAHSISGVKVKANPDYFQNPSPEYPELARQMRQEGLVILAVDVDSKGMPIKVEITQSSGFRLLDQAALKAVSHWKFQAGRMGDVSMEFTVAVPIRFRLVLMPDTHRSSVK